MWWVILFFQRQLLSSNQKGYQDAISQSIILLPLPFHVGKVGHKCWLMVKKSRAKIIIACRVESLVYKIIIINPTWTPRSWSASARGWGGRCSRGGGWSRGGRRRRRAGCRAACRTRSSPPTRTCPARTAPAPHAADPCPVELINFNIDTFGNNTDSIWNWDICPQFVSSSEVCSCVHAWSKVLKKYIIMIYTVLF